MKEMIAVSKAIDLWEERHFLLQKFIWICENEGWPKEADMARVDEIDSILVELPWEDSRRVQDLGKTRIWLL